MPVSGLLLSHEYPHAQGSVLFRQGIKNPMPGLCVAPTKHSYTCSCSSISHVCLAVKALGALFPLHWSSSAVLAAEPPSTVPDRHLLYSRPMSP